MSELTTFVVLGRSQGEHPGVGPAIRSGASEGEDPE